MRLRLSGIANSSALRRAVARVGAGLSIAAWRVRDAVWRAGDGLRSLRAEHARVSAAVVVVLLGLLATAGLALARLASAGPQIVNENIATRYVGVPSPNGPQLKAVTITSQGKTRVIHVRKLIRKPGRVTTTREALTVRGPSQLEPGPTTTVRGPTHTVTVAGPTETVTQIVTTTETVVVTTTVSWPPGP
jgi:hypothetical protein